MLARIWAMFLFATARRFCVFWHLFYLLLRMIIFVYFSFNRHFSLSHSLSLCDSSSLLRHFVILSFAKISCLFSFRVPMAKIHLLFIILFFFYCLFVRYFVVLLIFTSIFRCCFFFYFFFFRIVSPCYECRRRSEFFQNFKANKSNVIAEKQR